jgi:hypothetical protein
MIDRIAVPLYEIMVAERLAQQALADAVNTFRLCFGFNLKCRVVSP